MGEYEDLDDTLVAGAVRLVVGDQFGSLPRMQRRLEVDCYTADALMQLLEDHDVVGPERLGMSREVLVKADEAEAVWARVSATLARHRGSAP